jgi:hypothetical protein
MLLRAQDCGATAAAAGCMQAYRRRQAAEHANRFRYVENRECRSSCLRPTIQNATTISGSVLASTTRQILAVFRSNVY